MNNSATLEKMGLNGLTEKQYADLAKLFNSQAKVVSKESYYANLKPTVNAQLGKTGNIYGMVGYTDAQGKFSPAKFYKGAKWCITKSQAQLFMKLVSTPEAMATIKSISDQTYGAGVEETIS